jgi:hypothetical protein
MTIDKPDNPTQQRGQPQLSLLSFSTGDLGLPVLGTSKSRRERDPEEQLAFLQSILEQALEIANDVDDFLLEDSSLHNTDDDEDEENSRDLNLNQ